MEGEWCLPVWREPVKGKMKEYQEAVPKTWVNEKSRILFWPNKGNTKMKNRQKMIPNDHWHKFKLVKIKLRGKLNHANYKIKNSTILCVILTLLLNYSYNLSLMYR